MGCQMRTPSRSEDNVTERKAAPDRQALREDLFFPLVDRNYARYQEEKIEEAKRKARTELLRSILDGIKAGMIASAAAGALLVLLIWTGVM